MRRKRVYIFNLQGETKSFETIQECMQELSLSSRTFYNYKTSKLPLKNKYFIGYDQAEVEQRAREYWTTDNTNTKELEDQFKKEITEQNKVIEELMKQLKDQNNQLKEQNTLIQTLQNEITQLKQTPIQVQSIPQTKPTPETRKTQIDQPTQPVKVEQKSVIPVSAPAGTIIPYSSLPVPPKYINPPMRRYAEVKVDGELWNWTNESFRVWYKNPVDQNFHFHYCQGYDFQDEWNVSDQRPYCYLPDGEMFDYRERDKDEEHRKKWAIISDERNGCKRWLEERAKLVNFFKKQIDISPKMKGFCVPNMNSIMEPVVETTNYKGVYKIYDYADFFLMRKNICNSAGGVLLDKNNCFVAEDNILLRTYKEVDGLSFRFPLANMNKDDKKILSELSYANIPSTIPLSANGVYKTVAHKLNDEIEKEYMNEEEEVELII